MPTKSLNALVIPPDGKHTSTVIFAHGLGDTGYGWEPVADQLSTEPLLSHVKWILPHAPKIPITGNEGARMPAWFDIMAFGKENGSSAVEDETGMLKSIEALDELVQEEVEHGIDPSRIVFAGFSQGAAIALLSGLTGKRRFAAIAVLSGRLPLQAKIKAMLAPHATAIPIFWGHGTADEMIPLTAAMKSVDVLAGLGISRVPLEEIAASTNLAPGIEFHVYDGLTHGPCQSEISDLKAFLVKALPQELGGIKRTSNL